MDLSFTPEELAFRDEARAWIAAAMPPHLRAKADVDAHFEHAEIMEWHNILYAKGWVAPRTGRPSTAAPGSTSRAASS